MLEARVSGQFFLCLLADLVPVLAQVSAGPMRWRLLLGGPVNVVLAESGHSGQRVCGQLFSCLLANFPRQLARREARPMSWRGI